MDEIKEFAARAFAYCDRAGVSPSTVSRKLLGNGLRLAELRDGKSVRVDTLARAKDLLAQMEKAA